MLEMVDNLNISHYFLFLLVFISERMKLYGVRLGYGFLGADTQVLYPGNGISSFV